MIGKSVAHYTIVGKLGAGGMGEVYRASDGKLRREVALKVLPEAFTSDADRMARFEREAQLLASLNHPNIGAIYGIEESDDVRCLVLELIEGETLAERIARRPIPIDECLELGRQMCEALEAAHERGVIHRDLKPANIKLTPAGTLKILDFGLAKATGGSGSSPDLSNSPTLTVAATEAGMIMGTAAYMSPEQAAGKSVDRRADIWSFGVVLCEMLTGRRLYAADSVAETLASVIAREPDLDHLPEDLPPRVDELLRRCLRKDPRRRLRDIGDARILLEEQLSGAVESGPAGPAPSIAPPRRASGAWIAGGLLLAVVAAALAWAIKPARPRPVRLLKFEFPVAEGLSRAIAPALSPDGSRLAYRAEGRLWVRELSGLDAVELPGVDSPLGPFWSPDGKWIAYGKGDQLWKMPSTGGQPILLAETEATFGVASGGAWLEEGRILFATVGEGISAVSEHGGEAEIVLEPAESEADFHDVGELPGGRGVLFVVHREVTFDTISVLVGGDRHDVLTLEGQRLEDPRYAAGHLIYVRRSGNRGIWAVPFSLSSLEVTGEPFLAVPAGTQPTASGSDLLAYVSAPSDYEMELVVRDRRGVVERAVDSSELPDGYPRFSPDGVRVASLMEDEDRQVWVYDLERGGRTRITSGEGNRGIPRWVSSDRLMFSSGTPTEPECYLTAADGSGTPSKISDFFCWDASPNGDTLLYTDGLIGGDLFYGSSVGGEATSFVTGVATAVAPQFSPDGRFVVYQSDESSRDEVYLQAFPEAGRRWQVSTHGGNWPRWQANEIFYVHDGGLWAVEVSVVPEITLGAPQRLFDMPETLGAGFNNWPDGFDVSRDGQRFVMRRGVGKVLMRRTVTVVQDWLAEFVARN